MRAVVELVIGPESDAVPRARRFVRKELANEPAATVDNAELVVAELVTNALLHGGDPVTLRLRSLHDRLRVEVEDPVRQVPVRLRRSEEALTGRGLALVAAVASAWGVEPGKSDGKVVWAEIGNHAAVGQAVEPRIDLDALLMAWTVGAESAEPTFTVRLGAVPTDLLLDAKAHVDNLVREFALISAGMTGTERQAATGVAALVETVAHDFAAARTSIKFQAVAAAERGAAETELVLTLPASAADAGERYLEALDQADWYARRAALLTLETPLVHRVFRRWYVQALVDQLRAMARGENPEPPPTLQQRLIEELTALAHLRDTGDRLRLLQKVTAELTGAADVTQIAHTVVSNATSALGAWSARVYLLGEDRMLRSVATGGGESALAQNYEEFPLEAPLPGSLALRTGQPVIVRGQGELAQHYPQLVGVYAEERILHVAPLVVGSHRIGVLSLTFRPGGSVDEETQVVFVTALADACAQALERALATARAAESSDRLAFLAEASVVLSESWDYRATLTKVADLVVPRLADWCLIQTLERGELQNVALAHIDSAKVAWAEEASKRYPTDMSADSGPPNVMRTGASELYPYVSDEMLVAGAVDEEHLRILRELAVSSILIVPLTGRTGILGAVTMMYTDSGRRYDQRDVAFAEDLARRAALAVETASAFREQSGRLAEVTRVAEVAQQAILAPTPERLGSVALSARYVSAAAEALVGGDLYEVVERPGAIRLLIADVRGKGLAAVRTATIVLGEFRAAAADIDDLVTVATQIDRRLRPYLRDEDFVTGLLAEITEDGRFAIANCGHPPALRTATGAVLEIEAEPTPPLGLGAEPVLTTGRLDHGDRLLLYTDGVIEARDEERQFVDLMKLAAPLPTSDLEAVLDEFLAALHAAVGPHLGDDLALLVAEYRG